MTNPYRAMCAELLSGLDELANPRYPFPGYTRCAMDRARALLAQPVTEGPTDEELLRVAATAIAPYEISGITPGEYEPETECAVEAYGSELIAYARAVLARWGRPTPQPVAGEVAAALIELRSTVMGLDQMKMYVAAQRVGRAADLLERLASDNAGLEAAADSLWADNVSLLDN